MAQLFSPKSNTILRVLIVAFGVAVLGAPAALMAYVRTPWVTGEEHETRAQPIPFDHRHHTRDDGIDCGYCHYDAWRSPYAGLPETDLCLGCHNQIWKDSPLIEPLQKSAISGQPVAWKRVYNLPDFVFFDHSIHVNHGVGCESCHGRVDQMPVVEQATPMTMAFCLDCHRDPTPHLRPLATITWMGLASDARLGRKIEADLDVRTPTHCTACHR